MLHELPARSAPREALDLGAELRVSATGGIEKPATIRRAKRHRGMKDLGHPIPALAAHGAFPAALDRVVEPGPGKAPVPLDRRPRHREHLGDLVHREPAEEPELHDSRLPRIEDGEAVERLLQRDQLDVGPAGRGIRQAERHPLPDAAALAGPPSPA